MKDWIVKAITDKYEVSSKIFDSDFEVSPYFIAFEVVIAILMVIFFW